MPYRVYVDENHPNIIHNIYSGDVILGDYYRVIEETYRMIREIDGTVHTILRYENVTTSPPNVMQAMRHASEDMPSNIGVRVVVADTPRAKISRIMINIGRQPGLRLTANVAIVATLEEAYTVISEQ